MRGKLYTADTPSHNASLLDLFANLTEFAVTFHPEALSSGVLTDVEAFSGPKFEKQIIS